jgi:hypothetical protein
MNRETTKQEPTMPDSATFAMLLLAAFILLITPGPAVLYIVARSIDQGRSVGIVSVLGVAVGTLVMWRRRRWGCRRCSFHRHWHSML